MDRKNKKIVQEIPPLPSASSASSGLPPRNSLAANIFRPYTFTSPSSSSLRPPVSPTSFNYVPPRPYVMNQIGAGPSTTPGASSSSGSFPGFFLGSDPFSMRGENAVKAAYDKNSLPPPPNQSLTIGSPAKSTEVAKGVKGRGGRRKSDQDMESKKLKRILSNRLSAQKSRFRKLKHVSDMEKKVKSLQILVSKLSTQVQEEKDKQFLMTIEKRNLQNKISACANRQLLIDAEIKERIAELNRLGELHLGQQKQNNQEMPEQTMDVWELPSELMMDPSLNHFGPQQQQQPVYIDLDPVDGGDECMEEINMLNQLHLNQELSPSQNNVMMPGWEASGGGQLHLNKESSPLNNIMVPDWEAGGGGQLHLNKERFPLNNNMVPDWEAGGEGQRLTNVGSAQSGVAKQQNSYPNQQSQMGSFNSSMGELGKIFNFNPPNSNGDSFM